MITPRSSDPLAASLEHMIEAADSILSGAQRVISGMYDRRPTMTVAESIALENISTALLQVTRQLRHEVGSHLFGYIEDHAAPEEVSA